MTPFIVKTASKDVRVTLSPRGDVLHYCFYWKGERYRESTGYGIERSARAKAREEVMRVSNGGYAPSRLLSEAIEDYKAARWPEEPTHDRSFQDAKSRLAAFLKNAKDIDIGECEETEALRLTQRHFDTRAKKCKGRTVCNDRQVLSSFFKWLKKNGVVTWRDNPAQSVTLDMPPLEETEPEPYSQGEIERLLPLARLSRVWPIFVLCLGCGLRPAEALRLLWVDLDKERGVVKVVNKKGKRKRVRAPEMNAWVVAELAKVEAASASKEIFPFNYFSGFDMAAVVGVSLQRLRQTACTRAIEAGMELRDYVHYFGHSLAVAEKHYLKWGTQEKGRRLASLQTLDFSETATKSATENS